MAGGQSAENLVELSKVQEKIQADVPLDITKLHLLWTFHNMPIDLPDDLF